MLFLAGEAYFLLICALRDTLSQITSGRRKGMKPCWSTIDLAASQLMVLDSIIRVLCEKENLLMVLSGCGWQRTCSYGGFKIE